MRPASPPCICMAHVAQQRILLWKPANVSESITAAKAQMGGVEGMSAAEDIGRLAYTRHPAHGLCTFWRPRLDLSGMKALHPGRGLLMHCLPRV